MIYISYHILYIYIHLSYQVLQYPSTKKARLHYTTDEDVSINREVEFQDEDEFRNEQPLTPKMFTSDFSGDFIFYSCINFAVKIFFCRSSSEFILPKISNN